MREGRVFGPAIIQYWHEQDPPADIAGLIESFKARNPGLEHLRFSESSADDLIAARYGSKEIFLGPNSHVLDGRDATRALNSFFAFKEPGHPLLRLSMDVATANIEQRVCERAWPVGKNARESIWLDHWTGDLHVSPLSAR